MLNTINDNPTANWKATGYRIFLFHAMAFALDGILPDPYLCHALLFASALWKLSQRHISILDLPGIDEQLRFPSEPRQP